jgi:hypothetical protein
MMDMANAADECGWIDIEGAADADYGSAVGATTLYDGDEIRCIVDPAKKPAQLYITDIVGKSRMVQPVTVKNPMPQGACAPAPSQTTATPSNVTTESLQRAWLDEGDLPDLAWAD